jgi:tetratricopeptide (TPR) repeat protein
MMSARYDPIDAYYLPIGSFGELEKMGPEIEIWRIGPDKPSSWGTLPRAFAQAYVRGAATRLEGGEIAEALALVERGLALDADCADGYLVSARIMEQAGRDRGAIGFYERVVALKPERSDYWLALANAYSQLGDEDNAQRCYRRVLALEPDHPEAAALRRAISGEG